MIEIVLRRTDPCGKVFEKILVSLSEAITPRENKNSIVFPNLEIRPREQVVLCGDTRISLSHYEFFTLYYLAEHPGWVFTKEQIYEAVWEEPGDACGASVASVISQLRRKLWPENPLGGYIRTVHNSGYKFEPEKETGA